MHLLRSEGYAVDYPGESANGSFRSLRESPPAAAVIDLTRLPSHGRYIGAAIRGSKSTRHIPIVFVDGEPEKVERVRRDLPDAIYTTRKRLAAALKRAKPPADPVVPRQMMDSSRSTAEKLGVTRDARVYVADAPPDYAQAIGKLPQGAFYEEESPEGCKLTLWFAHGPAELHAALPRIRRLAALRRLWILWRKGKRDGLDGNLIRRAASEFGLVDYKVCSVNETWSGMAFAVKKP